MFSSHVIGGVEGDIGIYLYIMRLIPDFGYWFPRWFDLPIIYPHGSVLAWSDNFFLPAHLAYFLRSLGLSFVPSVNLVSLIVTFLNGFIAFLYFKRKPVGFFAGFAIQSLPFLALHLGHPQLQAVFVFPLALILLEKKRGFSLGLLLAGTFLYGVYLFFYLSLMLAILGFKEIRDLKFVSRVLAGVSLVIPFLIPYFFMGSRELFEGFEFRATPLSFIFNTHAEAAHFPGVVLGLVLVFVLGKNLGKIGSFSFLTLLSGVEMGFLPATYLIPLLGFFVKEKKPLWVVAFLFLALSFGSAANTFSLHSTLSEFLPGLASLRASGRMGLVFIVILILLIDKLGKSAPLLLLGVLVETSFQALPLEPYTEQAPMQSEVALVLPYSGELTEEGRIKSYGEFAKLNMKVVHDFFGATLVNGYSGLQGKLTERFATLFSKFPDSARIAKSVAGLSFIYSKERVEAPWLKNAGMFREYHRYEILDVDFPGRGTFLVHPSKKSVTVTWRSDKECIVTINNERVILNEEFKVSTFQLNSHRGPEPTQVYFEGCDIITVRSVN